MFKYLGVFSFLAFLASSSWCQLHPDEKARYRPLPPLREQAEIQDAWREQRLARIPDLLRKYNVDAWLMSQREHAEDTIWWSIKRATEFAAHRRTIVLFHTDAAQPNPLTWIDNTGGAWRDVRAALAAQGARRIAVNVDREIAFAGGLHAGEMQVLADGVGARWAARFVRAPMLAVEYVAARVPGQLAYYAMMQETAWALIEEAFSERVVEPGVTTTEDIQWWFREKMQEQNVTTWNQPRVSVITPASFPGWSGSGDTVQEGDVLHVDFGVSAMGMHTDTQHLAYVLRTSRRRDGDSNDHDHDHDEVEVEKEVPAGLRGGMRVANRMQDIVLAQMRAGRTGNEVLRACNAAMKEEGIEGQVYSHPIGDRGHAPGATMGFTNLPEYVPVFGELPILPNTYYSIELFASHFVPERNETLRFMLEENAYWVSDEKGWEFVRGRQERFHLVDSSKRPRRKGTKLLVQ